MSISDLRKSIASDSKHNAAKCCPGLSDQEIDSFSKKSPDLSKAISNAKTVWSSLDTDFKSKDPGSLVDYLQDQIFNFYPADSRAPYVALSANGPWIVTTEGSVIYETGGYGMIGLGHAPDEVLTELQKEDFMANVMSASFAQKNATDKLRQSIGKDLKGGCPFGAFAFLNSGSEGINLAIRLAELYASTLSGEKSPQGRKATLMTLKKGFHGRTDAPARVSDSSMKSYKNLPMLGKLIDDVYKVEMNDTAGLQTIFEQAKKDNNFICAAVVEPVMGEGNAGLSMTAEFYKELRKLTRQNECVLIIDSIQASLRAHGVLSIVDYPEMKGCDAPDMEVYSKALNAGQYPLSVIALSEKIKSAGKAGPVVYGNTMTANPKALNVLSAVLSAVTPEVQKNIVDQGKYFLEKLKDLVVRYPDRAELAQGTGLLLSLKLKPEYPVEGADGIEIRMRKAGVNVIHSAGNSLRFTPHFKVTKGEIDLIVRVLEEILEKY